LASRIKESIFGQALASITVAVLIGFAIYGALIWAPTEKTMGFLQRIFYFHAASGEVMILAFCAAFIGNVGYLIRRKIEWDWLAISSVEVGLIFNTISLVTGPIWAKPAWGIWWDWGDARLTSTFVLWVLYIGYVILRKMIENPERRAVVSSVFGVFAFLDVPLVYFSIWWWRTQHPPPLITKPGGLAPDMLKVFFFTMAALTALMAIFIRQRYKLEAVRHTVAEMQIEADYRNEGGAK
jgi:heme exporter protein C